MFVVEYTDDIPEILNKIKEWTNDDKMFPDISEYIEEVHRVMQEEGIDQLPLPEGRGLMNEQ